MYRNSRLAILLPILLAAAVVLGLLLGRYLGRNTPEAQLRNLVEQLTHPTNKLAYTLSLIETEYVDSVSMDSLSEQVIPPADGGTRPHSVYIPKSEMEAVNEPLQGEFDGIGVVFNMAPDTVIVLNVIPSGPSDKAGGRPATALSGSTIRWWQDRRYPTTKLSNGYGANAAHRSSYRSNGRESQNQSRSK